MIRYIDMNRERFGAEPICTTLQVAPSTYYAAKKRPACTRRLRDEVLKREIARVWGENFRVYGADKVWTQLNREGVPVARCTVERLMRSLGEPGCREPEPDRHTFAARRTFDSCNDLWKSRATSSLNSVRLVVQLMLTMKDKHIGVLLEDIQHKLGQVLEATDALSSVPSQLRLIEARLERVEEQTDLIPVIKAAITDQSRELKAHAARLTELERVDA